MNSSIVPFSIERLGVGIATSEILLASEKGLAIGLVLRLDELTDASLSEQGAVVFWRGSKVELFLLDEASGSGAQSA